MAILYKHFDPARIVFWTLFLGFLLIASQVRAQGALFTVDGIKVDVTAENALSARDQAFRQAQSKAFKVLADRMLSEGEAETFSMPDVAVISTLIKDYEITQEKLSSVRYIGTYKFRFSDKAVRRYFSGTGAAYTDVSSRPVLILPYYQHAGQTVLWSPYNVWMEAWNRADNLGGIVPVVVPLGDIQDVRDIGNDQSLTYDVESLQDMLGRYGAGEAVLVVATPDENLSLVSDNSAPANGALTIHIYRTDRARPEFVNQIVQTARGGQTKAALLNEAVRKVHRTLQKDWKKKTLVSTAQTNSLYADVPIASLQQWVDTREALNRVHGVNGIVVKSLTPKKAQIEIRFQGDERRLRLALRQASITLSKPRFSAVDMRYDAYGRAAPLVYELYLNRYAPPGSRFTIGGG